jgi:hypothetical protein
MLESRCLRLLVVALNLTQDLDSGTYSSSDLPPLYPPKDVKSTRTLTLHSCVTHDQIEKEFWATGLQLHGVLHERVVLIRCKRALAADRLRVRWGSNRPPIRLAGDLRLS